MTEPRSPGESLRHAMDSGELLLVAAAGMLVVAAVAQTAAVGVVQLRVALAFGALIAFGEVLRLSLPGGRESAPIASAGALAYAVIVKVGMVPATQPVLQIVAVAATGMVLGALPHVAAGRPARLTGIASRLVAVAIVAAAVPPAQPEHDHQRPGGLVGGAGGDGGPAGGWLADRMPDRGADQRQRAACQVRRGTVG